MRSAEATSMLSAARGRARELGLAVSVVIVDAAGVLVAAERVDDAARMTSVVAEHKAVGCVVSGRDSHELKWLDDQLPAITAALRERAGGRLAALGGGLAVRVDGEVRGAIGVSGGTEEQDADVAQAALAARG